MTYLSIDAYPHYSLPDLTDHVKDNLIGDKGKLIPYYSRPSTMACNGEIWSSLRHYFPQIDKPSEAVFCLLNGIPSVCKQCSSPTMFIDGVKGYRPFCSSKCNGLFNTPSKFLSPEVKKQRSEKLSKARLGTKMSDEWRASLKRAASRPDVKAKKSRTCLERYGVSNPGVLGAYSSKAATNYILRYIDANNISPEYCLFKADGKNEFFQMINVSWKEKMRYVSYDFAVFSTSDHKPENLILILEYQGPWHYLKEDIIGIEDELATPYPKSLTKSQAVEMDQKKRQQIREVAPNAEYLTYWWKSGELVRVA